MNNTNLNTTTASITYANNPNEKKKQEMNFEKLFISILEFQQEASKSLKVFTEFFQNYLNKNEPCNKTREILGFVQKMEENKKFICENIKVQKEFISSKNLERTAKLDRLSQFVQNYLQISHALNKNKRKYKENVLMSNSESASLNFHLVLTKKRIDFLKEEMIKLEDFITKTKTQSKNLVSQEYELMNKILTSGRELAELNSQAGKNKNELNTYKASYSKLVEKLEHLKTIKANFLNITQRNNTFLMTRLFGLQKTNENFRISSHIKALSANSSLIEHNFSEEESFIFSEILENSKKFHKNLVKKLFLLNKEKEEATSSFVNEEENLKRRLYFLFSLISSNYTDIIIENFTEFNFNSIDIVSEGIRNVNEQITYKTNKCLADIKACEEESLHIKERVRMMNESIVEAFREKKDKNLKKMSIVLMRSLAKSKRARKEAQLNAEREKEKIKEKERELIKERDNAAQVKIESLGKNSYFNQNNQNYLVSVNPVENNQIPKQRTKRNRKDSKENRNHNKENKKPEKPAGKEMESSNRNIVSIINKDNPSSYFNLNDPRYNAANNKLVNLGNNITENKSALSNQMTQPINYNNKYSLKVDIPTLEESFSKPDMKDIESADFLHEISKNFKDVHEFPPKTSTFGEKKKRILDHLKLI